MTNLLLVFHVVVIVAILAVFLLQRRRINHLQAGLKEKEDHVFQASHQLSTPITQIKGALSLMAREPAISPETRSFVERSLDSVEQLIRLVNDLPAVSRVNK